MDKLNLIHGQLAELRDLTKECGKEDVEPQAQALCETTHEVLAGLEKAFDHYKNKSEEAWK